mgnify:CR=1 FL=1
MSPYKDVSDLVLMSAILAERNRQRVMWGYQHDREHTGEGWVTVLSSVLGKVAMAEHGGGPKIMEQRLIQLAATAMAALEWEAKRQ